MHATNDNKMKPTRGRKNISLQWPLYWIFPVSNGNKCYCIKEYK